MKFIAFFENLKIASPAILLLFGCKTADMPLNQNSLSSVSTSHTICATDVTFRDNNHQFVRFLMINQGVEIKDGETKTVDGNEFVHVNVPGLSESGWVAKQFIVEGVCKKDIVSLPLIHGKPICQYSWSEKVGTTDYRVYDNYRRRNYHAPDRLEGSTLVGSNAQGNRTLCEKAKFLKQCFYRAVDRANDPLEKTFLDWARKRGYSPERILMAIAEQETKMGLLKDQGVNGVGLTQIVTAFKTKNRLVSDNDHATWAGITHNILTNLKYSMKAAGVKILENGVSNISDLGYYYNGSPAHQNTYARNIDKFYHQLAGCGL